MAKTETLPANLQREKLKQLTAKHGAPLRINDTTINGFYLAVGKKGASWNLQKRVANSGKPAVTFRLGKAWGGKANETRLKAVEAATKAKAWGALCEAGKDPRTELGSEGELVKLVERQRAKVTFPELSDYYMENAPLRETSKASHRSRLKNWLNPWLKDSDVTTLDEDACLIWYNQAKQKSLSQAKESMKLLSAMWTFGGPKFKKGGVRLLGLNPVELMKKTIKRWDSNKNPNTPVIEITQVGEFIAKLEAYREELKAIPGEMSYNLCCATTRLLLCMFTGLRINEADNMLWAGVDFKAGLFKIGKLKDENQEELEGGKETKSGVNHRVVMSGYVRALLLQLKAEQDKMSVYVFPHFKIPLEPVRSPTTDQLEKLRKLAGHYFGTHAMRRTFRGVCKTLGIEPDDVKRMMNHKHKGDHTDRYDMGAFNPGLMLQHWQSVASFLENKRNLYLGNTTALGDHAALMTAFLGQYGLTTADARRLLDYLDGETDLVISEPLRLVGT